MAIEVAGFVEQEQGISVELLSGEEICVVEGLESGARVCDLRSKVEVARAPAPGQLFRFAKGTEPLFDRTQLPDNVTNVQLIVEQAPELKKGSPIAYIGEETRFSGMNIVSGHKGVVIDIDGENVRVCLKDVGSMQTTRDKVENFRDPCMKCGGSGQTMTKDCEYCKGSGKAEDAAIVIAAEAEALQPKSVPFPLLERLDSASEKALDRFFETNLALVEQMFALSNAEMHARFIEGTSRVSDVNAMKQFREDMLQKQLERMQEAQAANVALMWREYRDACQDTIGIRELKNIVTDYASLTSKNLESVASYLLSSGIEQNLTIAMKITAISVRQRLELAGMSGDILEQTMKKAVPSGIQMRAALEKGMESKKGPFLEAMTKALDKTKKDVGGICQGMAEVIGKNEGGRINRADFDAHIASALWKALDPRAVAEFAFK